MLYVSYEDIISSHLLVNFVKKVYSGTFLYSKLLTNNVPPNIGTLIPELLSLEDYVPSAKCSVVLMRNVNSWSDFDVLTTFQEVVKRNKREDINFYSYQNSVSLTWYLPTLDGFPSIVLWKPNDKRPFVFNKMMNVENIEKWINSLC